MKVYPAFQILFILASSFFFQQALAQEREVVAISEPAEVYSFYLFSANEKKMLEDALGVKTFEQINLRCREENWPRGIASLDSRNSRRSEITMYHAYNLITLDQVSILEIDADANPQMSQDMLLPQPFYIIIGNAGLYTEPETEDIGSEEDNESFPLANILDPSLIVGNPVFDNAEIQDIIDQVGEEGYEYISANCDEKVFPVAVNSPTKRLAASDEIGEYKAFLMTETEDFSIIEITPEENLHMPDGFIPEGTFYFVIYSQGIEILP